MIWCIIGLSIVVIGITLAIIFDEPDWMYLTIPGFIFVIICGFVMTGHIDVTGSINDKLNEKARLEFALENINKADTLMALDIIEDARNFNKSIVTDVEANNNPWTNWFINDKYVDVMSKKFIDIPDIYISANIEPDKPLYKIMK